MTDTLFEEVHHSLSGHVNDVGLPVIQCPFVWANATVRDLFNSVYCGYPVGNLCFGRPAPREWSSRWRR